LSTIVVRFLLICRELYIGGYILIEIYNF
jgi:hypothetical protein